MNSVVVAGWHPAVTTSESPPEILYERNTEPFQSQLWKIILRFERSWISKPLQQLPAITIMGFGILAARTAAVGAVRACAMNEPK